MNAPTPFEIVAKDGFRVASNGTLSVTVFDEEGTELFRRRAASVSTFKPSGEDMVPKLNALATELLSDPTKTPEEVSAALRALAENIAPAPKTVMCAEWAVARLNGVSVYVTDKGVIVTTKDLTP